VAPLRSLSFAAEQSRQSFILRELRAWAYLSVHDLSRQLGVSDMTIRRDLRKLQDAGAVRVVHGGVTQPHGILQTADFVHRAGRNATGKHLIAKYALQLLEDGDTIGMDAGTTVYELAASMPDHFSGTIITNSIPVIQRMLTVKPARVVGIGGELLSASQAFVGPMTVAATSELRLRTFFLGAAGVDVRGVYVAADVERPTKRALIGIADRVILLADHSKFLEPAPVLLAPLNELSGIVTDTAPPTAIAEQLRKANVEIHVAESPAEESGPPR
jgi:DeoR family transcriptional regulator, fructose operon transcriptional repressor